MRPSWVEIDLGAVAHNVAALAELVAPARLCTVVKADAYGHGDVPVAETALEAGASWLAVALVEEGIRLREAGIEAPILVLSEPPCEAAAEVVHWQLTPTVYSHRFLEALAAEVEEGPVDVHLKVDTGMHRVGTDPDTVLALGRRLDSGALPLRLGGVWTHLAVAEEDCEFTTGQLDRYRETVDALEAEGIDPGLRHVANSPGAILYPDARLDLVRVGLATYGLYPSPGCREVVELRPAMRVVSKVSHVRRHPAGTRLSYGRRRPLPADATVATVPVGYADGYARVLSSRSGEVLIGGRRHPLAGTVTMDQIVVDVGDAEVLPGDEVVLLGAQGEEAITADEWAERLETITYEVACRFGSRLPRRYLEMS